MFPFHKSAEAFLDFPFAAPDLRSKNRSQICSDVDFYYTLSVIRAQGFVERGAGISRLKPQVLRGEEQKKATAILTVALPMQEKGLEPSL